MKKATSFLVLAFAILQIACRPAGSADEIFSGAQSLMESRPDSALHILKNLDTNLLRRNREKARYALLISQALDKNYIDLKSDSVIAPAIRYYSRHGRKRDKAYTYYYLGCIRYNAGDLDAAVHSMVEARSAATELNDSYLLARICSCLGRMFQDQHSFEEAETMFTAAENYFRLESDSLNIAYAIVNKAIVFSSNCRSTEAIAEYRRAQNIFRNLGDSVKFFEMTRNIVNELKENPAISIDSLKHLLINDYRRVSAAIVPPSDYSMWMWIYSKENMLDSARYYGDLALARHIHSPNRTCGLILQMCGIEERSRNYLKALHYWHKYYILFDSLNKIHNEQYIRELEERYRNKELTDKNELARTKNIFTNIIWGFVSVSSISLLAIIFIRIIRRYRQFIETLNANYDTFKERYLQLAQEIDCNSAEEANLLKALETKLRGLQHLLDKAYNPRKPQLFIDEFKDYAASISKNESAFADLQYVVNKKYNGLVDYLRSHHPTLTDYELDILCMLRFGFSYDCIRLLYRHNNIYSIYSRRTKIHRKLGLPYRKQIEDYLTELSERLKSQAARNEKQIDS